MSQLPDPPQAQPPQSPPPTPKRASALLPGGWIVLVVLAILAVVYFTYTPYREIEYSQFIDLVNAGQLKKVVLIGNERAEGEVRDPNSEAVKALRTASGDPVKLGSGKFGVNLPHTNDQPGLIREWETQDQKYRDELKRKNPEDATEKLAISKRDDPSWVGPFILNLLLPGIE